MKTRSFKQRRQSQVNGKNGKGPATLEGKARSAGNAVKHGIFAKKYPAPGESEDLVEMHEEELALVLQPKGPAERRLVAELANDTVRQLRLQGYLAAAQELQVDDLGDEDGDLRLRLRTLRALQVEWERVEDTLSHGSIDGMPAKVRGLVEQTAKLEADPSEADSAHRDLPAAAGQENILEHYRSLMVGNDICKVLLAIACRQHRRVRAMVSSLRERMLHRQDLRMCMASAVPDEVTIRLADRYNRMIARDVTNRLQFIRELRELGGKSSAPAPKLRVRSLK
jgi:hypothetical protein